MTRIHQRFDVVDRRLDGMILEVREIGAELSALNGRFRRLSWAVAGGTLVQLVAILLTRG